MLSWLPMMQSRAWTRLLNQITVIDLVVVLVNTTEFSLTLGSCCWHFLQLLHSKLKFRLSPASLWSGINIRKETTAATAATRRTNLLICSHWCRDWLSGILSSIIDLVSWKRSWKSVSKRFIFLVMFKNQALIIRIWRSPTLPYSIHSVKPLLHVNTFSWNLCATALAKQVSGDIAPCNMVDIVKHRSDNTGVSLCNSTSWNWSRSFLLR